ncbi:MAG: phage portal protein [Dietzia sp.]
MKSKDEVKTLATALWSMHQAEQLNLDTINDYVRGEAGYPSLPEGSEDDVKEIRKKCVHNVLSLVRDTFVQNLVVSGYRPATSPDNARPWTLWRRNRMTARQRMVYRDAVTYGAAYVVVSRSRGQVRFMPRSPRQLIAVYADARIDEWPVAALDTWTQTVNGKKVRRAELLDETHSWLIDLGEVPVAGEVSARSLQVVEISEPIEHGARLDGEPVCPVVRFVNDPDSEELLQGEIGPLIDEQRAINEVNFERMIVARFGAWPQKVISGWEPSSTTELLRASARHVWAFGDAEVKTSAFPAGQLQPYTDMLVQMIEHVAASAQISPASVTGKMINVSAEALAAAEAKEQRKLAAKRDAFGESWEQVLRLGASLEGDEESADDVEAEVIWTDTEARTFAQVIDGIAKLTQGEQALPIVPLLPLIPGLTALQRAELQDGLRRSRNAELLAALPSGTDGQSTTEDAQEIKARFDAMGVAIRSGVDSAVAAERVGLSGLQFTGAVPVTLRMPEQDAAKLED